jgi:o-succinylbenzoate synthase
MNQALARTARLVLVHAALFSVAVVLASGARRGVLLTLVDEDGFVGLGEASPLAGTSPDDVEAAARALDEVHTRLAPTGSDDPIDAAVLQAIAPVAAKLEAVPSARFALETALFDLFARRARISVGEALGGSASPAPVLVNALVEARLGPQAMQDAARAIGARGYAAMKAKVGRARWDDELRALRALREALPDVELRLDANGAWSIGDARRRLAEIAPLGARFVEQPVAAERLVELGACETPWAADESLRVPGMAERLLASPCAAFVLKPAVLGGLLAARDLAHRAHARGLGVVVTHLFDGPVALAAYAELALSLPSPLACGLDAGERLAGWPRVDVPQRAEPTRITKSDAPGLGIDLVAEARR